MALIDRQVAIDALWKALYEYEDKTEKQFQESEDLDLKDWILHRIFVQDMNDIDRQTILNLPSAQSEIIRCKECKHWLDIDDGRQKHRMCADVYGDWFCADAERRNDVSD